MLKAKLKMEESWTWTNVSTSANTSGTTQSISVTVGGPSFGYAGPTDIAVYYDVIYQTFAFRPVQAATPALHGRVLSRAGEIEAGQEVIAVANGTKYRTFTNTKGEYRFFSEMSGPIEIQVGGITQRVLGPQTVGGVDVNLP